MLDFLKNNTVFLNKYKTHSEAIIISCFFNPQNSPYRIKAFNLFYDSIKHLNHSIIECVIGDSKPQLEENKNIKRVYTKNLLWHKESLLNKLIQELDEKYKYVFWIDADVLFTNKNWLVEGVEQLKTKNIIQPFEYCVHLNKDEVEPSFDLYSVKQSMLPNMTNNHVWRSFCSNYATNNLWKSEDYNTHGHVGFAWGARRDLLKKVPLYDKALIGGADHIIAHASSGQLCHKCITKSFTDDLDSINKWSTDFYMEAGGKIGYVKGDLYHIWHGDVEKRQYLKRIQDFTKTTKEIKQKDDNGLYLTNTDNDEEYIRNYFLFREVVEDICENDNTKPEDNFEFGGGDFGGGGAGGDYELDNENFS
jgi:hypothetical protein